MPVPLPDKETLEGFSVAGVTDLYNAALAERTSLSASVNEETVTVGRAASRGNAGLSSLSSITNQFARVNAGVPVIPTPASSRARSTSCS